jgi:hypothetical protein
VDKLDKSDKSVEYYDEEDEEVFSMTTQTEKDSMVSEFRNRKGKRVLPFSTGSAGTGNPLKNICSKVYFVALIRWQILRTQNFE